MCVTIEETNKPHKNWWEMTERRDIRPIRIGC
jgi:hypothetical protein